MMLNKCQTVFERKENWISNDDAFNITDANGEEREMTIEEKSEEEYRRQKIKRRILGNITFIGELF